MIALRRKAGPNRFRTFSKRVDSAERWSADPEDTAYLYTVLGIGQVRQLAISRQFALGLVVHNRPGSNGKMAPTSSWSWRSGSLLSQNGTPIMKWPSIRAGRSPRVLRRQPDVELNSNLVFGSDARFSGRLDPVVDLLHNGLARVTAVL